MRLRDGEHTGFVVILAHGRTEIYKGYRWAGTKLLQLFEDILFSRTNSNGIYRVDL